MLMELSIVNDPKNSGSINSPHGLVLVDRVCVLLLARPEFREQTRSPWLFSVRQCLGIPACSAAGYPHHEARWRGEHHLHRRHGVPEEDAEKSSLHSTCIQSASPNARMEHRTVMTTLAVSNAFLVRSPAAGVTDHVCSAAHIVAMIEAAEPAPAKHGPHKKPEAA